VQRLCLHRLLEGNWQASQVAYVCALWESATI
jgi:hypothetical protein